MDLKGQLDFYAKITEKEISKYIDRTPDELYEPIRDLFARGGKRLRPALCMVACQAVGGKKTDALKVASFIEMVHNFTLIHDDIADRSELRRGQPCLHHKYGLGLAVNSGDGLFSTAYEVLSDATAGMDAKRAKRLWALLSRSVTQVCEGQALDIGWVENKRWGLTEKDYFEMIRRKTGVLMSAACEAGAITGGGSEKEIKALRDFGMGIGVGFQIHDDVLNLRADVKKYGKEIGGDINEGKRTLMAIYTLSACTPQERRLLINILDRPKNSPDEIMAAIEMMEKYGSIDRAAELSKGMIGDAKQGLDALKDSEAKRLLLEIADYLVKREL